MRLIDKWRKKERKYLGLRSVTRVISKICHFNANDGFTEHYDRFGMDIFLNSRKYNLARFKIIPTGLNVISPSTKWLGRDYAYNSKP